MRCEVLGDQGGLEKVHMPSPPPPIKQRIHALRASLSDLSVLPEDERTVLTSKQPVSPLQLLDERLSRFQTAEKAKVKALRDELDHTQALLAEERDARASLPERTRMEAKQVEASIHHEIWEERRASREFEEQLLKKVRSPLPPPQP